MAAPVETFGDADVTVMPGNAAPYQKRGHDGSLGVGGGSDNRWPGSPGESVFRILVPGQKIGAMIGRKGESIKRMCEESRARIKVLDAPPGTPERAVMISAKEEPDASISPAMDGLLRVHKSTTDGLDSEFGAPPTAGSMLSSRLLVPATQAGSLIGKQGANIKSIQEASNCLVRVLGTEELPVSALADDRVVEIQGEPIGVRKAVELIASQLRKFLVDRSVLPLFENNMSIPNPQMEQNMSHQPWGHPQGGPFPGSGFGGNPQYMAPAQQPDNYYPPSDFAPPEKQPYPNFYGRDASMGIHSVPNSQPPPQPIITQITQHMQIPLSYADAVIGTAGASISYIRRASGATITIQETRGVPGEMTVEINGTATQVQTAQQLIQNFMAEAAGSTQNPAPPVEPVYNSYPTQGSVYSSPPSNSAQAAPPGGIYGSVYSGNYGY